MEAHHRECADARNPQRLCAATPARTAAAGAVSAASSDQLRSLCHCGSRAAYASAYEQLSILSDMPGHPRLSNNIFVRIRPAAGFERYVTRPQVATCAWEPSEF